MSKPHSRKGTSTNDFEVECIRDRRERAGRVEYLLKWKGCAESECSWEPEGNLNCQELLTAYEQQQKLGAPEEVLGAARMNSEIFYLVKRRGSPMAEFVSSRIAAETFPLLIIQFYERRYSNVQ